jgi:putative ABC transport system permease protein
MENLRQDLRYGILIMLKSPGFTIVAVIALALGIGANTAIFSVINTVLLKPLPYKESDRIMVVRETKLPRFPEFSVAPGNFLDWQKQNTLFENMAAQRGFAYNLIGSGDPERLRGARITSNLFSTLGVKPIEGRDFLPEEDQEGRDNVVIISHGLWQRRFGSDPKLIGQTINLNGKACTVIGIMPSSFWFPNRETELWAPMAFNAKDAENHGGHFIGVTARLKPGITREQAETEMKVIAGRLEQQYPVTNKGWSIKITPILENAVGDMRPALMVLFGAVAFVLLIVCANIANLLLSRAATRQKEIAIRSALGAGRWRVVRQLLTESILLSLVGSIAGLLLAVWGLDLLLALAPKNLPRIQEVSIDGRTLGFTLLLTLFIGLLFGLAPALQASSPNLNDWLKEGSKGGTDSARRHRLRNILVVSEVALSLVLLVGAGLMMKSFLRLQATSTGFNPQNIHVMSIALPDKKYPEDQQQAAFFSTLLEKISAMPGVQSVGASQVLPFAGDYILTFDIQGRPPAAPGEEVSANYYAVSHDYFKAMGIPLLRGRFFTDRDRAGSPGVAIINENMAKKYFPDEDPMGKRINISNGPDSYREIVGIVGDVKHYGLDAPSPAQMYEPYLQQPFSSMNLVIRTSPGGTISSESLRKEVLLIDKEQPISRFTAMEDLISDSVARQRFSMILLAIFAVMALILAAVGIYGVISYSVTQRTNEIGIRMALGAQRSDILRMILRQGMGLALAGVVIGLTAAYLLTRLISSMLYEVSPTDPLTFAGISLLLLMVALLSCVIPARRATNVDPMIALRYE